MSFFELFDDILLVTNVERLWAVSRKFFTAAKECYCVISGPVKLLLTNVADQLTGMAIDLFSIFHARHKAASSVFS